MSYLLPEGKKCAALWVNGEKTEFDQVKAGEFWYADFVICAGKAPGCDRFGWAGMREFTMELRF